MQAVLLGAYSRHGSFRKFKIRKDTPPAANNAAGGFFWGEVAMANGEGPFTACRPHHKQQSLAGGARSISRRRVRDRAIARSMRVQFSSSALDPVLEPS